MNSPPCSLDRFERFCGLIGLDLEPFQRQIVREAYGPAVELVVLLPRGNGKTTLLAAFALHHLLTTKRPAIYCAASSRDQSRILFEAARDFAAVHPAISGRVTSRHLELRVPGGFLRVLASDAPKVHGLTPSLALVDELHAHRDAELYLALRTALLKRPHAKMVTISTAGYDGESALGQLRSRALALPSVKRTGSLTVARGPTLALLEWAVPEGADVDDPATVKAANPGSWIGEQGLADQRAAVHDLAFRRYHANQWTTAAVSWLPPGAWAACADDSYEVEDGEPIWLGVDIGGSRAASAIVAVTENLDVADVQVFQGDEAVLAVSEAVRELARRFAVQEVAYDPWRYRSEALRLEAELGLVMVEFPQSHARMTAASENLHSAIVEKRLRHFAHPDLDRHVSQAVAKSTGRGWRLDKASRSSQIDAVVALCMAGERAEHKEPVPELLGWL